MSPRTADPDVRVALIEAAARLIAERQPLTARRLAAEVKASTMAVYTHFGGMEELRRAVRREGFARLGTRLGQVETSRDPVADVVALGVAYCLNALANPHLYRIMFLNSPLDAEDATVGIETFDPMVSAVDRCIRRERLHHADSWSLAMQLWLMSHGLVAAVLAGLISPADLQRFLPEMAHSMFVALGDSPKAASRSIDRALHRMERSFNKAPGLRSYSSH